MKRTATADRNGKDTGGTNRSATRSLPCLLTLAVLCAPSMLVANDLAGLRAAREQRMGPVIAMSAGYTTHSPGAAAVGGGYRCSRSATGTMTEAEYLAKGRERAARYQAEWDKLAAEDKELYRKFSRSEISVQEKLKANAAINNRRMELQKRDAEQVQKLEQEWKQAGGAWSGPLQIYLQHTPSNPDATIIPFDGLYPSAAFIAELNRVLRPFLASCGDRDQVRVSHYFKDEVPYLSAPTAAEPPIREHRYTLRGGTLQLQRHLDSYEPSVLATLGLDPAHNRRLTLAGLQAEKVALSNEQSRRNADYRKDFHIAAKRRRGIVYKYDAYWAQYRNPDLARRIFDGDFANYVNTTDFRALFLGYAQLYTSRCEKHVKSFTTLYDSTRTNHRSEELPGTDIIVAKSDPKIVPFRIDSRFAKHYQGYEGELTNAYMARVLGQMKEAGRGDRKRPSDMTAGDFAAAVKEERDYMTNMAGIFPEFFDKHLCESAAMTQLGENILRAADGRASLQQEGSTLANAERESDPPQQ